jgi:hypothetical protein
MRSSPQADIQPASRTVGQGPGYLFSAHRNVLIACWTAQGTEPLIEALAGTLTTFVALHPERVTTVHVIAAGLPLATAEAREALATLMKQHGGALACVGTVLEGSGFWASATRGVIVGLQLLAPKALAMRTCASVSELTAWLPEPHAQRTGIVLEAQELERAIMNARARASAA